MTGVASGDASITATSEEAGAFAEITVSAAVGRLRTWVGAQSAGPGPADWSGGGNWNPAGEPIPLDTARIEPAATPSRLSQDVTIARLILAGGTLRNGGHALSIRQP